MLILEHSRETYPPENTGISSQFRSGEDDMFLDCLCLERITPFVALLKHGRETNRYGATSPQYIQKLTPSEYQLLARNSIWVLGSKKKQDNICPVSTLAPIKHVRETHPIL